LFIVTTSVNVWGPSGTAAKEQGPLNCYQFMGQKEPVLKA